MTKESFLSEIRRLASVHGGRVGLKVFLKASGIPEKQILGKHWSTWNEALTEAGIATAAFKRMRTPDDLVLEALAHLVGRLGKLPTENELALERRRDPSFPSLNIIRRLRRAGGFEAKLLQHCSDRPEFEAARLVIAQLPATSPYESMPDSRAQVQGYVYLMRSGRRYKIGHTTSPTRRHREVRLDLPDPTILVHSIETDDPTGIESYWHRRFASKRVRDTEFFTLDAADVVAFKRRRYQ